MADDSDSGPEDVESIEVVEFEDGRAGFLSLKTGKKKYKYVYFVLAGSSLYQYKNAKAVKPSETYQIKGFTVEGDPDAEHGFCLKKGDKVVLALTSDSKEAADSWRETFTQHLTKEPKAAPDKEKVRVRSSSRVFRAKKGLAGKMAVSGLGKKAVSQALPEEAKVLIAALKQMIAGTFNAKKAEEIEEHLIKIVLKCFFLESNKIVPLESFLRADKPLREAFEILIEMRDYRHRMTPERVARDLKNVHLRLKEVENVLTELLVPHLQPKSIKRIAITFGLLASFDFLDNGWAKPELEDARDLLVDAMNQYTAFHFGL